MNKSDESYRLLFNNPKLVRSLVDGFIQMSAPCLIPPYLVQWVISDLYAQTCRIY